MNTYLLSNVSSTKLVTHTQVHVRAVQRAARGIEVDREERINMLNITRHSVPSAPIPRAPGPMARGRQRPSVKSSVYQCSCNRQEDWPHWSLASRVVIYI